MTGIIPEWMEHRVLIDIYELLLESFRTRKLISYIRHTNPKVLRITQMWLIPNGPEALTSIKTQLHFLFYYSDTDSSCLEHFQMIISYWVGQGDILSRVEDLGDWNKWTTIRSMKYLLFQTITAKSNELRFAWKRGRKFFNLIFSGNAFIRTNHVWALAY